jgi:hypothetical protein
MNKQYVENEQYADDEQYIACIIIGHGGMLTTRNSEYDRYQHLKKKSHTTRKIKWKHEEDERRMRPQEDEIMPKIINLPMNISLCTFAVPTESCAYPDDKLIALKDELLERFEDSENMNDDIFKNILHVAQRTQKIGFTYSSDEWAPFFSKRHEYSEKWIRGRRCIDKKLVDCPDATIECGIYILQNNVGLENGTMISYDDGILFSKLFDYFANNHDVNKMYLLDTTCSVVYNPEMNGYINDERVKNNIFKHALTFMSGGKKYNFKKKIKNKSRKYTFKKNKSRKYKKIKNKK